jgi:flavin-dependent dehydrogenase
MNSAISRSQVLVIGASLAGSSLALRLAKNGITVTVIDKGNFPRRKACGEGVSSLGITLLKELGVTPGSAAVPANPLDGYVLWQNGRQVEVPFTAEQDQDQQGFGIPRLVLDKALLDSAAAAGAQIQLRSAVREVLRTSQGEWQVHTDTGTVCAPLLVLADGANSFIAESLGIHSTAAKNPRFGFSMVLKSQTPQDIRRVHILVHDNFELACTPVSPYLMNTTIMAPRSHLAEQIEPPQLKKLIEAVQSATGFSGELCTGDKAPLGIGPLNRSRRGGYHNGIFLVGDACETLDPIGGMGMTHALLSSKLAAQALEQHLHAQIPLDEVGYDYENQREMQMRALRGFTRLTYFYVRKISQTSLFPLLGSLPLVKEVSRAAHRNFSHSALGVCAHALLNIVGYL